ncbi:MAG: tRNA epoxyqueuosine(34) reductase QueG [Polyangiaceae bacterium]
MRGDVAPSPASRAARVAEAARALGFDAVGIARADVPLDADFARYEAFVEDGKHASMSWLASLPEARRRLDGEHVLPGAKSVVCLARRYPSDEGEGLARHIARYARGRDYHNGVRKKLRKLAKVLRAMGTDDAPVAARPLCDEEPILERAWAARAGLGFVGKNGMLIVPGVGSFVLLGEVVTTAELEPGAPMRERCGSCVRCLDACPTGAFEAPFVLDPRKCVAYLTIEHRGAVEPALREGVGEHLFGCDDCQTVCPFNAGARAPLPAGDPMQPHARWSDETLASIATLDHAAFLRLREGSPVGRATREGLARNAALVLGNRADPSSRGALERAAADDASEVVRDAASWALRRLDAIR